MKTEEFDMLNDTSIMKVIHDCPFCGKRPEGKFTWGGGFKLSIKCQRCGITMQRGVIGNDFDSMVSELYDLIDTWNGEKKNNDKD